MASTDSRESNSASRDLISLKDILTVFNNPLNEEQAWAVCYKCARFLQTISDKSKYRLFYKKGNKCLLLHRDGDVIVDLISERIIDDDNNNSAQRRNSVTGKDIKVVTESDAVQALGLVIYQALDYGVDPNVERTLSRDLEELIELMTNPDAEDDELPNDEGIETDAKDGVVFSDVILMCEGHLSKKEDAGQHYKAVCRAIFAEARELLSFLDQISKGQEALHNITGKKTRAEEVARLDELECADWARLWVQVMRELRNGVRLKRLEPMHHTSKEFELTPFEMLLEDIKAKKYNLKKIMVNGDIPLKVKSDAHAMILEFIRSRPPLQSVKDRILKSPPKREKDPIEKLMEDIRAMPKLKPVKQGRHVVETSRTKLNNNDDSEDPLPARRVIKVGFDFKDIEDDTDESESQMSSRRSSVASPSPEKDNWTWRRAVVRDLTTSQSRPVILQRRNTITVCESPQVSPLTSPLHAHRATILEEGDGQGGDNSNCMPSSELPSGQENGTKVRRSSAVIKARETLHELRKKLHDSKYAEVTKNVESSSSISSSSSSVLSSSSRRSLSPVRARVRACLTRSTGTSDGSMDVWSSLSSSLSDNTQHAVSKDQSDNNKLVGEGRMKGHVKAPMQRSSSVSQILKDKPKPMVRSRTASEISLTKGDNQDSQTPNPSPSPLPAPRSKPVPAPRRSKSFKLGRSSSLSSMSTSESILTTPRDEGHSQPRSRSEESNAHEISTTKSLSDICDEVQNDNSKTKASSSDTLSSNIQRPCPAPRPRSSRSLSQRSHRHSMDLSSLGSNENQGDVVVPTNEETEEPKSFRERYIRTTRRKKNSTSSISGEKGKEEENSVGTRRVLVKKDNSSSTNQDNSVGRSRKHWRENVDRSSPSSLRSRRSPTPEDHNRVSSLSTSNLRTRRSPTPEDSLKLDPSSDRKPSDSAPVFTRSKSARLQRHPADFLTLPTSQNLTSSSEDNTVDQSMTNGHANLVESGSSNFMASSMPLPDSDQTNSSLSTLDVRNLMNVSGRRGLGCDPSAANLTNRPNCESSSLSSHSSSLHPSAGDNTGAVSILLSNLPLSSRQRSTCLPPFVRRAFQKWSHPIECLSLTMEEVTHIRSVLTKADLETVVTQRDLYQALDKGKVCFTCRKVKFSMFGQWGTKCKICKRTVCNNCLRKMNVPTEHFENVPVHTLSPIPLSSDMLQMIKAYESTGSVPHSPDTPRRQEDTPTGPGKSSLHRSHTISLGQGPPTLPNKVQLKGPQMSICCDCKNMIMDIIRTSRNAIAVRTPSGGNTSCSESPADGAHKALNLSSLSLNVKQLFSK